MKKPMLTPRTRGFTLVELMVSIVIVAALVAMVFALTKNAMAKTRLAASSTAVRNLGVQIQGYTQDNAGLLPVWKDNSTDLYWWGQLVTDPENESQLEIFRSPGHREFDAKASMPNLSYGWNARVVGRYETSEGDDGPKRMAGFREPSRILVLADGARVGGNALLDESVLPDPERYNGKAAGLMLDGSARTLEIERDFKGGRSEYFLTEEERDAQGGE
jgi:prepilin-type N-terminal cleavage/methylation domain-containing protein